MGPHQEDEGFFHRPLAGLPVIVDKAGFRECGDSLPLRNEVGKALPDEDRKVVSQAIRRYRLGGLKPLPIHGHILTIDSYATSTL